MRSHDHHDELLDLLPYGVPFGLSQPPNHQIPVLSVNQSVHCMADIHNYRLCIFKKEAAAVGEIK